MIASMTLAEIKTKYADVHTPEEVAEFKENMTNSKKWKVTKGEWTWDGLTHVQLRGRALQYHPGLDMLELYKEHPYKTALRLVPKEENLEDSGDEESEANSDLEEDDDVEADYDDQIKEAVKQYTALKKRLEPPSAATIFKVFEFDKGFHCERFIAQNGYCPIIKKTFPISIRSLHFL